MKKLFTYVAIVAIMCRISVIPAYASGDLVPSGYGELDVSNPFTYLEWVFSRGSDDVSLDSTLEYINRIIEGNDTGCPNSPNGCHHWQADNAISLITGAWDARCSLCGEKLSDYKGKQSLDSSDFEDSYNNYVHNQIPLTGIDNTGGFYWYPTIHDISPSASLSTIEYSMCPWSMTISSLPVSDSYGSCYVVSERQIGAVFIHSNKSVSSRSLFELAVTFKAPVSGTYFMQAAPFYTASIIEKSTGNVLYQHGYYGESIGVSKTKDADMEYGAISPTNFETLPQTTITESDVVYTLPVYRVIPSGSLINTDYSSDYRPGNYTGDYGIIGDNGTIQIDNRTIVDESDNSVYNPVTGDTTHYDTWKYDYSTRTYTFDLSSMGDTTTVKYGADKITVYEGGVTYNIYYMTPDANGGDQPNTPHVHNYTEHTSRAATCTDKGLKTFTCSCGDSYTQDIPALGHNWEVKTEVQTEYNEQGELVTQGYKIYRCSRCGEEYRSDSGAPPDNTDLTLPDNTGLDVLGNKLLSLFERVPEMIGDINNFLTDALPYVPEDVLYLIEFSLSFAILMAIIKLIRR